MYSLQNLVATGLMLVVVLAGAVAFVQCLMTRPDAFVAAGKLSKPAWSAITGVATLVAFAFGPISLLGLIAVVGIVVYWVDVRPALQRVLGRGGSDGPYGRW
ncbi:DUF2516 family protein [Arsenicicoccus sp. oral taxon 190]|uniref:DUF2516 family protein n=1 Tax=Arsenicicoccus sp. oral taxon 190 TaxID=1658671 RepID=UPI0009E4BC83|nr:DUF2516 family protein [Arsenicicoccus sp. oral taxon 190]